VDRTESVPQIAHLSIALGVSYLAIAVIGAFGLFAAMTQRAPLVRIYSILAAVATLIVFTTGLTRVITHFIWKNDLIKECSTLTTNQDIVYYGFWGPVSDGVVTPQEAASWCQSSWNHDSWAEIVALLILTVLGCLFTAFAFSYHRQLMDPTSPANASRGPSSQTRVGAYPAHYNPAYVTGAPTYPQPPYAPYNSGGYGYGAEREEGFVPPYDGKPPGYIGDGMPDAGKKDPFADDQVQESDVTSRPRPGGDESFGYGARRV